MTRIGINPARHRVTDYRPARVTVGLVVFLPHLTGYFEHRFDVFKLCLATLAKASDLPYDLLVFDNGSCEEVKAFLRRMQLDGSLRYLLTSSENIGKLGAMRLVCGAAPGEVVAYTDDDTFFYPGWLSAHLALLEGFPQVGMVSGLAVRTLFDHGIQSSLRLAETDPEVHLSYGETIPRDWEMDWAVSLGRDPEAHWNEVNGRQDIVISRGSMRAYATASHNQFVAYKRVINRFLEGEWSGRMMGGMVELDTAVDQGGLLRLATLQRTTRAIGSFISPAIADEARRCGIVVEAIGAGVSLPSPPGRRRAWLRWKPVRWFLQGLYNRLFWVLTEQSGGWLEERGDGRG